ncbi:hypothetical protein NUW58_g1114 [Xylaria curta]|uniref:Uncharacterized protein n=1 Tax=Xylaria curta TaxID=42375 RepID=A0ACC1PPN1_9PEZI|nr:hypothetical protein NUW58_g1114 [Xylaria curta]
MGQWWGQDSAVAAAATQCLATSIPPCGYATEAMRAVLQAWWALPRDEAVVHVHPGTLPLPPTTVTETETEIEAGEAGTEEHAVVVVREHVVAEIAAYNAGSRRVLEKLGFRDFGSWEEPDTQLHRLGQPLLMGHFVLPSPS